MTSGSGNRTALDACRALILEDDDLVARMFTRELERLGMTDIWHATTAAEAMGMADELEPDLMLVDIHLGKGHPDGLHFLKEAKSQGWDGLSVVMSGDQTFEQFFRAALAGANDYLVKGGVDDLGVELERIMSRRTDYTDLEWRTVAVVELGYLRSWGIGDHEIWLLEQWAQVNFPRYRELAEVVAMSEKKVSRVFKHILETLGLKTRSQLADVIRTCCS
jgi:DNA-binding NarL/FixJ family response regulator